MIFYFILKNLRFFVFFQNAIKWSNLNLKSWFTYLQNPPKKICTQWQNKYRDVQRRKGVFNLKAYIPQDRKISNLIFVVFSFIDLPKYFSSTFSLEILRYHFLTTSGPMCIDRLIIFFVFRRI